MNKILPILILFSILTLSIFRVRSQTFNRVNKVLESFSTLSLGDEIIDIKVDQQNNTYICGVFNGNLFAGTGSNQVLLTPTNTDYYAAKYDANQNLVWAKRITQGNATITQQLNGFDIDQSGNIYLTGALANGSKTFGFGETNQTTLVGPPFLTFFESLFFLVKLNSINGQIDWIKSASSVGSTSNPLGIFGHDVVCDNFGGVVVVGNFFGTASFGTLPSLTSNNESNLDGFVAKYNQNNGSELWVRKGPTGPLLNIPNAVDVDEIGNIYFIGNFSGYADIVGISNAVTIGVPVGGDFEMFVAKYNPNGEVLWANQSFSSIGLGASPPSTAGQNIVTDAVGNSYITGVLQAQSIIFGNFSGSFGDTKPTFYLAKINSTGTFEWIKQADVLSAISSNGNYVALGSNNNPFVSGGFNGTFSFDGISVISVSSNDNFIANYDKNNGQLICLKHPKPETGSDKALIGPITSNGNGVLYAVGNSTGIAEYGNIDAEITPDFFPANRLFISMYEECCVLEDRIEDITYSDSFSFYGEDSKSLLVAGFDAGVPALSGDVVISPNTNVHYTSEGQVTLKPGFHALNGSVFKASIADCGNTYTQNNNRYESMGVEEIVKYEVVKRLDNPYQASSLTLSTSKEKINKKIDFDIFPNPNKGLFSLKINSFILNQNENSYIVVTNLVGGIIIKKQINSNNIEFDLLNIEKGIYFVRVTIGSESITKKVIVI